MKYILVYTTGTILPSILGFCPSILLIIHKIQYMAISIVAAAGSWWHSGEAAWGAGEDLDMGLIGSCWYCRIDVCQYTAAFFFYFFFLSFISYINLHSQTSELEHTS